MNYNDKCRKASNVKYEIDYSMEKPISSWGYVGYSMLWSLPVLGIIFWLVACFSERKIGRRNFARSYVCMFIVSIIVCILMIIAVFALLAMGIVTPEDFDQGVQTALITALG